MRETKDIKGWVSPVAIHPGEFLKDALEDFHMTQVELSERAGLSPKVINEIINGKNPITRVTAFKLSKVFSTSEEYWVNLQNIYDSDKARLEEKKRIEEDTQEYLPQFAETYKELSLIGITSGKRWIKSNYPEIVLELQKFYAADSLGYVVSQTCSQIKYRKYTRDNLNLFTLAAWLRLGKIKAQKTDIPAYSESKLKEVVETLPKLSLEGPNIYLPKLESILNECGVVLAYLPKLKNTHVQGAATWVGKDKALIMLNASNKHEDRFWFSLLHEMGHILKHSKKEEFIDLGEREDENHEEEEADEFAQEHLVPNFKKVFEEVNSYSSFILGIQTLSKKLQISPSILAGRIAHEFQKRGRNIYANLNGFLETRINYSNLEI